MCQAPNPRPDRRLGFFIWGFRVWKSVPSAQHLTRCVRHADFEAHHLQHALLVSHQVGVVYFDNCRQGAEIQKKSNATKPKREEIQPASGTNVKYHQKLGTIWPESGTNVRCHGIWEWYKCWVSRQIPGRQDHKQGLGCFCSRSILLACRVVAIA